MKAFYDSLETLQKVQFAKRKDYINLGIGVAVAIVVFGAFFIGVDTIWSGLYKGFYTTMRGSNYVQEQNDPTLLDENTGSLLEGLDLSDTDLTSGVEVEQMPLDTSNEQL